MSSHSFTNCHRLFAMCTLLVITPITAFPVIQNKTDLGCYDDSKPSPQRLRLLDGLRVDSEWNTVDQCGATCLFFTYFGVENGNECYCGNSLARGQVRSGCNHRCKGIVPPGQLCGGSDRISVYSRTPFAPVNPGKYLGCFEDNTGNRHVSSFMQTIHYKDQMLNGPQNCRYICGAYRYYSMQNGDQCFCTNMLRYTARRKPDSECANRCTDGQLLCGGSSRNRLYEREGFNPFPQTHAYAGCYKRERGGVYVFGSATTNNKALRHFEAQHNTGDTYACQMFCVGFKYFALYDGKRCACSDVLSAQNKVADLTCNTPCVGNRSETCGRGNDYWTVWGASTTTTKSPTPRPTPRPTAPVAGRYVSCCTSFSTGSWQAARQACIRYGDDLATIFNETQNAAAARACTHSQGCWIGLRAGGTGQFAWMDGSAMTYNRFAPGEPASRNDACVVMSPQGEWKVAPCATALPTICELPVGVAFVAVLDVQTPESSRLTWFVPVVSCVLLCLAVLGVAYIGCAPRKQVLVGGDMKPLLG